MKGSDGGGLPAKGHRGEKLGGKNLHAAFLAVEPAGQGVRARAPFAPGSYGRFVDFAGTTISLREAHRIGHIDVAANQ